jgi:tripartite-type tricarboxylate transporter receptor subunit TctC
MRCEEPHGVISAEFAPVGAVLKPAAVAIAFFFAQRAALDIPTSDEAGLPGFHAANWSGLWVPKGTSKDVVRHLNAAVVDAWPTPLCVKNLLDRDLKFRRLTSKRRKLLLHSRRLKSTSDGRLSKLPTLSSNEVGSPAVFIA